jgi:hypothetical protein
MGGCGARRKGAREGEGGQGSTSGEYILRTGVASGAELLVAHRTQNFPASEHALCITIKGISAHLAVYAAVMDYLACRDLKIDKEENRRREEGE